jgi:hypothetical protein
MDATGVVVKIIAFRVIAAKRVLKSISSQAVVGIACRRSEEQRIRLISANNI